MGNSQDKQRKNQAIYRAPAPAPQARPAASNAVVAYRPQQKQAVRGPSSDAEIGIIAREQIGVGAMLQIYFTTMVLDCSGSMAGGKWRAVLNGVNTLLSQMKDIDMVGAVTFNDKVSTVSALQPKEDTDVMRQLSRVATGGGTHLYEAIMEGLQLSLAGNMMTPDSVGQIRIKHTMIILTDGEDTGSRISLQQTCQALRRLPAGIMNIVFIGIGLDSNSKANLQSLADACGSNGTFQDVGCSAEEIASVFDHVALVLSRRVDIMGVAVRQGADGPRRVNA